jgi:predicted component of type VI protein secretion system
MSAEVAATPNGAVKDKKAAIHFEKDAQASTFVAKMAQKNSAESRAVHEAEATEYSEYYKRNMVAEKDAAKPVDDADQEAKRKAAAPKMTKLYYDLVGIEEI